jgi:hypothetical protein
MIYPNGPLLPLQVVSGTHLDINITFEPPIDMQLPSSATTTAPDAASAAANFAAIPASATEAARVGLVFKSWKSCGRGAAVLSFDWSKFALTVDFDEPLPDAYTPHPEDTPERKRVGGTLRNYVPGELTCHSLWHKCTVCLGERQRVELGVDDLDMSYRRSEGMLCSWVGGALHLHLLL